MYDKDGKFAYGYTLDCSGRFGVGWNGDNIAVYFVREDIAATFDRNANNITCDEIPDTTANSSIGATRCFIRPGASKTEFVMK